MDKRLIIFGIVAGALAAPTLANSLIAAAPQKKIARSTLSAQPASEWNRLSARGGKFVEVWTIDGDELNKVTFYGGVPVGQTLFKQADKKHAPLPKVSANMLITDIPALLESSYRIQLNTSQMSIDSLEPAMIGRHKGVKFTYSFVRMDDDVQRKGEAVGAFVANRLYIAAYEAPAIHFFDKDVAKFRQLAGTLKI
ncbi:MAG TPA: hypothetical protein VGB39_04110 [Sphingomicrobium sp.]|jgi:hypothetical protein